MSKEKQADLSREAETTAAKNGEPQQDAEAPDGAAENPGGETEKTKQESAGNSEAEKDDGQTQPDENAREDGSESENESERYMRLMADFQNYKRRCEQERSSIYNYANEKIIGELLSVADNFERALLAADADDSFVKGMTMIFDQLKSVMEKAGTAEIAALGEEFDPNFHNAVMTEDSEEYESGKVTAVLQKGYTLNGKVIRPSMVKVAN